MNVIVRLWRNRITTTFLAGLVMLLPVVLTIIIIAWIVNFLQSALGPESLLGGLLTRGGMTITGPGYENLAFFLGIIIALAGIFFIGIAARTAAQRSIEAFIDSIFTKLPIIRAIYNPVSRLVKLTTDKTAGDFTGMQVVSCRFGGENGADMLALLANQEVFIISGERRRMIYLPTSPVPMSGALVMVPEKSITPIPEMKVDDLMRTYFSLGALAPDALPEHLKVSKTAPADIATPTVKTPQKVAE